jgi:hypothetical protein
VREIWKKFGAKRNLVPVKENKINGYESFPLKTFEINSRKKRRRLWRILSVSM